MAKRKTRWADGDTRAEPYVFVTRNDAVLLGLPTPENPACEGDFYDTVEVARARVLAQYKGNAPPTDPDEGWPRLWVVLLAFVALHTGVICWAIIVGD